MAQRSIIKEYISEIVYGGLDGAVTTFAIVAGSIGASLSSAVILILGFANLFADGFSMAASNYLSTKSRFEVSEKHMKKYHSHKKPRNTAIATFLSFLIIGFIPLLSFVMAHFVPSIISQKFLYSSVLTAFAFLMIGSLRGRISKKKPIRAALETLVIGSVAALIAFFVGFILRNLIV